MLRDKDRPGDDGYTVRTLIMESAKEGQEWTKCLPSTEDLPTTHEHFIAHKQLADGRNVIEIGVRRKPQTAADKPIAEPDKLNSLSEPALETEAARKGLDVAAFKKLPSKAKKVEALRAVPARANNPA